MFFTLKKIKQKQNICALLRPFPFWLLYLCTCHRYFPWLPSRPVIPMMNSYQLILVPKVPRRGSRLPHLRSTSGKYWDKYLLWPKRSWDRVEPTVGKLWNVKKTFPDFRILKPYLDQNFNAESRLRASAPPHPPPFDAKFPNPVLQISLLFVENPLSALNGAWNLIVSFHFLSYCFVFFCLLPSFVPFLMCFIPAHFGN